MSGGRSSNSNNNDNNSNNNGDRGLVVVYTGRGKGKTTAALGIVLRAVGHGYKVGMIQFIKGEWYYGELTSSKRLEPEFEMIAAGRGFVGIMDDDHPIEDHQKAARQALAIAKEKLATGSYDVMVLDEINYAVKLNLISEQDVLDLVKSKPARTTLVLTGNYATDRVIEAADLVTEMKEIKHPYQSGIKAKKGIDF
ncbi:cob(I)yrinic acid a,c-diamide adenosyltransferase [Nitrososphaera sp.]|uniref:cob(I)yrinic acid a,c-diamide adenosyltransferase n=1 Tax=Nitrososphaera sp. TaxID=1971748 RepID=UPI00307F912E